MTSDYIVFLPLLIKYENSPQKREKTSQKNFERFHLFILTVFDKPIISTLTDRFCQ